MNKIIESYHNFLRKIEGTDQHPRTWEVCAEICANMRKQIKAYEKSKPEPASVQLPPPGYCSAKPRKKRNQ